MIVRVCGLTMIITGTHTQQQNSFLVVLNTICLVY